MDEIENVKFNNPKNINIETNVQQPRPNLQL